MLNIIIIKISLTINELFIIFIMIISTSFKNVMIFGFKNFIFRFYFGMLAYTLNLHWSWRKKKIEVVKFSSRTQSPPSRLFNSYYSLLEQRGERDAIESLVLYERKPTPLFWKASSFNHHYHLLLLQETEQVAVIALSVSLTAISTTTTTFIIIHFLTIPNYNTFT